MLRPSSRWGWRESLTATVSLLGVLATIFALEMLVADGMNEPAVGLAVVGLTVAFGGWAMLRLLERRQRF